MSVFHTSSRHTAKIFRPHHRILIMTCMNFLKAGSTMFPILLWISCTFLLLVSTYGI